MAFSLRKKFRFEAAHFLPNHDGKCKRLHGHSWEGELEIRGHALTAVGAKEGMLMDFGELSAAIKPLLEEKLDHYCLNETLPMPSPTSEAVAQWIFKQLKPKLPMLHAVTINETCTSSCTYTHT